jgi:hypothetical protein
VCSPLGKEQTLDTQSCSHGLTSLPGQCPNVNVFAGAVRENAAVVKLLRRGAVLGLLAGIAYAAWRMLAPRTPRDGGVTFESSPFPSPPRPVPSARVPVPGPAAVPLPAPAWVEPDDGACPTSHPVKAKMASGIFHVPGGGSYDRTNPDRCYADAASAEADGLRAAKN